MIKQESKLNDYRKKRTNVATINNFICDFLCDLNGLHKNKFKLQIEQVCLFLIKQNIDFLVKLGSNCTDIWQIHLKEFTPNLGQLFPNNHIIELQMKRN